MKRWRRHGVDADRAIARLIVAQENVDGAGTGSRARAIATARDVLKLSIDNSRAYKVERPLARRLKGMTDPRRRMIALVREAYIAAEAIFGEGSVYRARRIARALGARFRDRDVAGWLKRFRDRGRQLAGTLFDRLRNLRQYRWLPRSPAREWPTVLVGASELERRRRRPS